MSCWIWDEFVVMGWVRGYRVFLLVLFVVFRIRRWIFRIREQFRYKLLPYYLVNPAIKMSLLRSIHISTSIRHTYKSMRMSYESARIECTYVYIFVYWGAYISRLEYGICMKSIRMKSMRMSYESARIECTYVYIFIPISLLQCVAVCCSKLQCVAVICSVLQCIAVWCSVLLCVAALCNVLQCVAVYGRVLLCVAVCSWLKSKLRVQLTEHGGNKKTYVYILNVFSVLLCVAVCCRVLPCVAVCCRVLPCVAVCCRALQYGVG